MKRQVSPQFRRALEVEVRRLVHAQEYIYSATLKTKTNYPQQRIRKAVVVPAANPEKAGYFIHVTSGDGTGSLTDPGMSHIMDKQKARRIASGLVGKYVEMY